MRVLKHTAPNPRHPSHMFDLLSFVMPHIEYNGGAGNAEGFGFSIANAYLVGASYPFSCGNANFSTYIAYKYNAFEKASNDVQWTGT